MLHINFKMACIVRVPTEVVKQRMQTKQYVTTSSALKTIFNQEGLIGFYRGYLSTVAREVTQRNFNRKKHFY